jgi:hypothetical protein
MYLYHETTNSCGVRLAWFTAEGRSIHEVATLFQKGHLRQEFVRETYGKLDVAFVDAYEYKLTPGEKYHLFLKAEKNVGYVRLVLYFEKGAYVANWYRMQVDNISTEVWKQLFPSKYVQKQRIIKPIITKDISKIQLRPQYLNDNRNKLSEYIEIPVEAKSPVLLHEDEEFADYNSDFNIPTPTPTQEPSDIEPDDFLDEELQYAVEYDSEGYEIPPITEVTDPVVTLPTRND